MSSSKDEKDKSSERVASAEDESNPKEKIRKKRKRKTNPSRRRSKHLPFSFSEALESEPLLNVLKICLADGATAVKDDWRWWKAVGEGPPSTSGYSFFSYMLLCDFDYNLVIFVTSMLGNQEVLPKNTW